MDVFTKIVDFENIKKAYKKVMSGSSKFTKEAQEFNLFWYRNLRQIQEELKSQKYEFGEYYTFTVYEPKKREIDAPAFRDKIVQHAINNILIDIYEPAFHPNSFACIRGKGNQRAVKQLHKILRRVSKNNKTVYYVKLDVYKFFPSIDKNILINILKRKIKCSLTIHIITKFIFSYFKTGLPLGVVLSQLFANIYLDTVDFYASKILKIKNYIRYADDIFIITTSLQYSRIVKTKLQHYIYNILNMQVGRGKSFIKITKNGISGLGHVTFCNKILILYKNYKHILAYFKIQQPSRKDTTSFYSRLGIFKYSSIQKRLFKRAFNENYLLRPIGL